MSDEYLKRFLIKQVYPVMLSEAGPSHQQENVLWRLLVTLARQMAVGRGLGDSALSSLPCEGDEYIRQHLPQTDLSKINVTLLGEVYTALMPGRHRRGSYYTPQILAESIAHRVLPPGTHPVRIVDPAMGSGHFLLAAAEVIAKEIKANNSSQTEAQIRWQTLSCLHGIDIDPVAVDLAAISLWLWAACPGTTPAMLSDRLVCGDALLDDRCWQGTLTPPFDVVIGNPPYASAITRARASTSLQSAIRSRYHTARGSFDLSVPFVERAISLCKPGGRCGLVLPNKLLAAEYGQPLRVWLAGQVTIEAIFDASRQNPFEAGVGVYPVAAIFRNTPPSPDEKLVVYRWTAQNAIPTLLRHATQTDLRGSPRQSWSSIIDPHWDVLHRCWEEATPLGDLATLASGLAVGEAYKLRSAIVDVPDGDLPEGIFRLLTSGLIRRHTTTWGQTPAAYLKTTYHRPAIHFDALPARRREQSAAHKIVVAGLGKTPRAVVDHGQAQASVSTTIIIDAAWPLGALCALLNSHLVGRLCQAIFGGLALGGGHLRFGKPELACIPLPTIDPLDPRLSQLDTLANQRASLTAIDAIQPIEAAIEALVCDLYGVDDDQR